MRMLIVDDDAVFREELAELLRDDGHEVATAPSVVKGLEVLEHQDEDVVFTDLKMPRQSGLELLRESKKRWPTTLVVMITGYATVETAVEAMKDGAFDYIRKPFKVEHVRRVLELAQEEIRFRGSEGSSPKVENLVRSFSDGGTLEVLWLTDRKVKARPHVTIDVPDMANPFRIGDTVDGFLNAHAKAAVVLEGADRLFPGHRREEILAFLATLRDRLSEKGPLVVTFDPAKLSAADVTDLRGSVMAPTTRATLESLSNPLRRAVLRRAALGACSFTEAMHAAGLDDSPKLSFHLHKLVDDGLLTHQNEEYRITPKGKESVRLLGELDAIAAGGTTGNSVLAVPAT